MSLSLDHDVPVENLDACNSAGPSHMLGGIAHDFRNFIHIIAVSANRMKKSTQDIKMVKQCDLIIDVCRMAFELVNDTICLAKGDQNSLHEIDLNREVERRAALIGGTLPDNVQIKMDLDPSLPAVAGNASEMGRVIVNLVNNAKDAVGEGGQIMITSQSIRQEEVGCQQHADTNGGDFAAVAISDTGPGISSHLIPRIFDPFVSTKNSGDNAGLGLTMARAIIERHRGWIDVKSQIGQGTCFTVYLPAIAKNIDSQNAL